jgi:hypothetical protein
MRNGQTTPHGDTGGQGVSESVTACHEGQSPNPHFPLLADREYAAVMDAGEAVYRLKALIGHRSADVLALVGPALESAQRVYKAVSDEVVRMAGPHRDWARKFVDLPQSVRHNPAEAKRRLGNSGWAAVKEEAHRFGEARGWSFRDGESFSLKALATGKRFPGYKVFISPNLPPGNFSSGGPFDHGQFYWDGEGNPVAIVAHLYADDAIVQNCIQWAESVGLGAHVQPDAASSWYWPGSTRTVVYTRPGIGVWSEVDPDPKA